MTETLNLHPFRWRSRWREALEACSRSGGEARPLVIGPPADSAAVDRVEKQIGMALPAAFRRVVLEFSAEMEFSWFLSDGYEPPDPFNGIFSGGCSWTLHRLADIQDSLNGWVSSAFPNPDNPYDRVWHNKLGFLEVGNGDMLALDLAPASAGQVVYLSHDAGDGHGYSLGHDFADFVGRWSELGCPGAEDWQWLPFTRDQGSLLDAQGHRAREWRKIFGMSERDDVEADEK